MAVMDEFKEERAKVKEMSLREKIDHFVFYHKVGIMLTALVVFLAVIGIYDAVTGQDSALYIAMIDCISNNYSGQSGESYETALAEQLDIDTKSYMVVLDNSFVLSAAEYAADESVYQLPEMLYTRLATGQLHAFMAQESTINGWVMNDGFLDLREEMTPEQYEYYKDSFYWIDYDILENYELDFDTGAYVYNEDHRSPEGMKNPMPVGVYITPSENEDFQDNYTFLYDQEIVYCLTYTTHKDDEAYNGTQLALDYLDILSGRTAETAE